MARGRWCTAVAFAPDGATIASGDNSGKVTLWSAAGEKRWEVQCWARCTVQTRSKKNALGGGAAGRTRSLLSSMCGSNPEVAPEVNKAKCFAGCAIGFFIFPFGSGISSFGSGVFAFGMDECEKTVCGDRTTQRVNDLKICITNLAKNKADVLVIMATNKIERIDSAIMDRISAALLNCRSSTTRASIPRGPRLVPYSDKFTMAESDLS